MDIMVNWKLMILVFVVFLLCIYFLNRWLYVPILNFMDSRDSMIEGDVSSISENDKEIARINDEIEAILENARGEAAAMKNKAVEEAKVAYEKKIAEIKENNEKNLAAFLDELGKNRAELKDGLFAQMPAFKKELMGKIKEI